VVTVPPAVTVLAGATTANFRVTSTAVSYYTLVDVAASYGGQDQFAEFSVRTS
jgi:hypothetical protein